MEKSQLETARLIYVAATRARRALHLVTCVSRKKDGALSLPPRGSALSHIWPETALELEQALRDVAPPDAVREDEPGRVIPLPLVRLASDWQPPPLPAAIAWPPGLAQNADALLEFEWVRPIARHVGTVVHRALSAAAEQGIDQLSSRSPAARRARLSSMLRSLGVSKRELGSAVARAEQALTRVAEDPRARWVVDADHHDAHSELALTAWMDGRTRRVVIDRTFVDASGTRWIVDFKTGRHEGGALEAFLDEEVERYREQLENYAEVMVLGGETRPIKLGLYFPVFAGWREWCYREAASV
jgi:ATP-dependent exoDNAse (exonuclease V) beta subunit